eukprot:s77_g32.t1
MKVPRNARICASRVVEYVPQYDEQLTPRTFVPADRLTPVSTAVPAEAEEDPPPDDETDYTPSFAGDDVAVEDVAKLAAELEADILEGYEPPPKGVRVSHDDVRVIVPEEAAEPSAPSHPLDDKLLVELGTGEPYKDDVLKKEATSKEHLLVDAEKEETSKARAAAERPSAPSEPLEEAPVEAPVEPPAERVIPPEEDEENIFDYAVHWLERPDVVAFFNDHPEFMEVNFDGCAAEADGLLKAGTWDLSSVREKEDVRAEAKRSGVSVHFGQLMTIASIKFHELAEHLQKIKGRIVYRGDCAKDEHGAAAVYQELGANPWRQVPELRTEAYGTLPGHCSTAADAVKAYVQALLSSRYKTWIELPPELRPKHWRDKFVKPVVLLIKALYGHPDAGGLWEQHLKKIIKNMGGSEAGSANVDARDATLSHEMRAFSTLSNEKVTGLKALAEEEVSKMKEEIKLARDAEVHGPHGIK